MSSRPGSRGVGFGSTEDRGAGTGFGSTGGFAPERKRCDCGRYEAISGTGVVVTACRNCGGEPPGTGFRKGRNAADSRRTTEEG